MWPALLVAGALGFALGALAALLWRARREQALRVELTTLLRAIKTDEVARANASGARSRTREQLQRVFGELARDSLQEQQRAVPATGARAADAPAARRLRRAEGARDRHRIAGAADPRGAGEDRGADSEHRARSHRLLRHHQEPDGDAGERTEPAVARDAQPRDRAAPARCARPMGRDHPEAAGRAVRA